MFKRMLDRLRRSETRVVSEEPQVVEEILGRARAEGRSFVYLTDEATGERFRVAVSDVMSLEPWEGDDEREKS